MTAQDTDGTELIGRARDIERLRVAIGSGEDGVRFVVLRAEPGVGATRVLRTAADAARDRGFDVAWSNGRAGTQMPGSVLRELLPALAPSVDDMPRLEVATSLAGATVADRCATRPMLLVIDDARLTDEWSAAVMHALLDVDPDANVTLALVLPPGDTQSPGARLHASIAAAGRIVSTIELGPLDDDSLLALVRAHAGGTEAPEWFDEVVTSSHGNAWLALELVRGGPSHSMPTSIVDWATSTYQLLEDPLRDAVGLLALSFEPLDAELFAELDLDMGVLEPQLQACSLVGAGPRGWTMRTAIATDPITRSRSAAARRADHRALADAFAVRAEGCTGLEAATFLRAAGVHLAAAGAVTGAVDSFERATTEFARAHEPTEAVATLRRALTLDLAVEDRLRLGRALALRTRHWHDPSQAVDALRDLAATADRAARHEELAFALHELYWLGEGGDLERLRRAAALGDGSCGWAARAAASLAFEEQRFDDAVTHDDVAIRVATERGDERLLALALQKQAVARDISGHPEQAMDVLTRSVTAALGCDMPRWAIHAELNLAELHASFMQGEQATAALERASALVVSTAMPQMEPEVDAFVTLDLIRRGDLDGALTAATRSVEVADRLHLDAPTRLLAAGALAFVHVERGDVLEAERAVTRFGELVTLAEDPHLAFEYALQQARLMLDRGDAQGAIAKLATLDRTGDYERATLSVAVMRIIGLHGGNDASALGAAIRAEDDGQAHTPWGALVARRLALTLDGLARSTATGDDELAGIHAELDRGGRRLESLQAHVSAHVRADREGTGRVDLDEVRRLLGLVRTVGARVDADELASLLRRHGEAATSRTRSGSADELTARELEIAHLVSSGMPTTEVAARLRVQPDTITRRLTNIYRKAGVRSRVELAGWIREQGG